MLFNQLRLWAPQATIDARAQEELVGAVVLQNDVRYTQIWFDALTSRSATKRTSQLEKGEQLLNGEWTILERLASGGQATAYLAHRRDGTKCVLKEFILSRAENSGALIESARDFEAEASLLSQLQHDRIVKLIDFFAEDGRVYVVLEHIEGQSLRELVKEKGPLDQRQAVEIALAVCEILSYLHGLTPAMVHRDLTPENIIVQPDGRIKLIDFSLAIRHKEKTMTASVGKNSFTPPEQFQDQACPQSDIYALGATLYYALTGVIPKPLSKSSPKQMRPEISATLNDVVERATELELAQRYESIEWVRLDLESLACQ
jgi:serine/threonine-protein kinase